MERLKLYHRRAVLLSLWPSCSPLYLYLIINTSIIYFYVGTDIFKCKKKKFCFSKLGIIGDYIGDQTQIRSVLCSTVMVFHLFWSNAPPPPLYLCLSRSPTPSDLFLFPAPSIPSILLVRPPPPLPRPVSTHEGMPDAPAGEEFHPLSPGVAPGRFLPAAGPVVVVR